MNVARQERVDLYKNTFIQKFLNSHIQQSFNWS